jgi:hypothetical protein
MVNSIDLINSSLDGFGGIEGRLEALGGRGECGYSPIDCAGPQEFRCA